FCTTCGKCETHCQTKIPIFECWNIIKAHFAEEKKFLGFSILDFMAAAQEATGNIWGIPGDQRIKKIISNSANSDTLFWAGCTLSIRTDEADDINIILNKAKINFKTSDGSEECCGLLLLFWGHKKRADNLFGKNIENFNAQGIKTIVTSCASCYLAFKKYYPVFASQSGLDWKIDVLHISELINNQIEKQILNFNNSLLYNLTYHDPCYLGKHANLYDPPRKTLKSIPGVKLHEMDSSQDESLCCGNLITRINNSIVSGDIANNLIKAGNDIKASSMVTACHFCEMQLDFANDKNFDCISFVSLIRQALEPDYKPESLALIPYEYINLFQQITQNLNYFIVLDIINGNIKDIINPIPMAIKKARDEVKKASILSRISSNVRMEKAVNENIPIIIKEKTKQIGELAYNLIFPQILDIPATLQNSFKQIIICYVKQIILKNELKIIEELRPEIMCEIKKI
ncbi:(Fe-S)-binding protein, partial [Candidatus Poribacteria bacterium]|nr:(Fe-S)-binding protein [Candidatus Poribacteria bacterium]